MDAITEIPSKSISAAAPPAPGTAWPEQGGIYVGSYVKNGNLHHGIIAAGTETDIKSSFDALDGKFGNLCVDIADFTDWRVPDQRETMLAYIHAPDDFERKGWDSIYLTATPYGSDDAWVVDFERGSVSTNYRSYEWRVRPFRSIIA